MELHDRHILSGVKCRLREGRRCLSLEQAPYNGGVASIGWCRACPSYDGPARGLGDIVATVTHAVGIAPCGGCQKRRERLNEIAPNPFKPG